MNPIHIRSNYPVSSVTEQKENESQMESAILKKNAAAVELLLKTKVDPNGKGKNDDPYLLLAIYSKSAEIVSHFLDKGADPNVTDKKGSPLISRAVESRSPEIVELFLAKGANPGAISYGKSLLELAYEGKDTAMIQLLLQKGANPNKYLSNAFNCNTLLIGAVLNDESNIVEMLLQNGADSNLTNRFGKTALQIALAAKRKISTQTVVALINNGALSAWDWQNNTCREILNLFFKRKEMGYLIKHLTASLEQNTLKSMCASFMNKKLFDSCEQKTFEAGVEELFRASAQNDKSKQQLINDSSKILRIAEEYFGSGHTILTILRSQLSRMY